MEIDLEKLKELAQKATPGPWKVKDTDSETVWTSKGLKVALMATSFDLNDPTVKNNSDYIAAASPDVVLALITDYQDKKDALFGVFLLVNKLRDTLSLPKDTELREVIDAATERIERLEREADWLACKLEEKEHGCKYCVEYNKECIPSLQACGYKGPENWRQAARRAVEDAK